MDYFSATDRSNIESIACHLQEIQTLEQFEEFILNELPQYLGAEFATWNEHNESLVMIKVRASHSHQAKLFPLIGRLNETLPAHPLSPLFFTRDGSMRYVDTVERTLDHISIQNFHQLDFYKDVASLLHVEDQLLLHIAVKNGKGFLITLQSSLPFTEKQQMKASVIRGHLVARFYGLNQKTEQRNAECAEIRLHLENRLTPREMDVILLICSGIGNEEIATTLSIAKRTADKHVSNILSKLKSSNRSKLISRYATYLEKTA